MVTGENDDGCLFKRLLFGVDGPVLLSVERVTADEEKKIKCLLYARASVCAGHENVLHSDVGHIGMRSTDPANGSSL